MARGLIMRGRSHSLPVICVPNMARAVDCRRNGLGNIFQGQKPREVMKVTRGKVFSRSMSTSGEHCTPVGQAIRLNLHSGDFEIHDELFDFDHESVILTTSGCQDAIGDYPISPVERELDPDTSIYTGESSEISLDQDGQQFDTSVFNTRRLALADIFANVEQDLLVDFLAVYSASTTTGATNEIGQYRNKTLRRNGVGNVHEIVNKTDLKMFLTAFEGHDLMNGVENSSIDEDDSSDASDLEDGGFEQVAAYRRSRRNALADIYDGVGQDEVRLIAGEQDEIEEEAKQFRYESRRMALSNITDILTSSEISRLSDTYCESESVEGVVRSRGRRSALANIYSEVDTEELDSFLKQFSTQSDISDVE